MDQHIAEITRDLLSRCRSKRVKVATAESCTGGMIVAALTAVPGSSEVVDRGFVTYSNYAKIELLGVSPTLLSQHGAVSPEVAKAMAEGGLLRSHAQCCVSVSGIAGPAGGSEQKPVGTVHIAVAMKNEPTTHQKFLFPGDRDAIRAAAVIEAMKMILARLG